jgi:hypothetical protein
LKTLFRVWVLAAFIFLFASANAAPVISQATINYSNDQITLSGKNLVYGTKIPKVVFDGADLMVIGTPTKIAITAQLNGVGPGTYEVRVVNPYEVRVVNPYGTSNKFEVTYATGPQGPMGPQGPQGPAGPAGATGPAGMGLQEYRAVLKVALLQWWGPQAFQAGTYPVGVAFDGTNIWVTNGGNGSGNTVTVLNASTGKPTSFSPVAVGTNPQGIAFDGTNIWVANTYSGNVTELRASDGSLVGISGGTANPQGVAFDGTNVWVTISTTPLPS